MTLVPAAVEVWLVDLERCREGLLALEAAAPRLPAGQGMMVATERHLAHIALRCVLARFAGAEASQPFQRQPGGRPELPSRCVSFSLSHTAVATRGVAVIAAGRSGPIGVDIEGPREVNMADVRRQAIVRAASALHLPAGSVDPGDAMEFLAAWTRIEALAKADGGGVARLLTHLGARGHGGELPQGELAARAHAVLAGRGLAMHDLPLRAFADRLGVARLFGTLVAPAGLPVSIGTFPETSATVAALTRT